MVTYGDYFSRKMLYTCGVSPSEILFNKDENPHTGMERTEKTCVKTESGDIISARGYGKFVIRDVSQTTKKGRLRLFADRYI